METIKELIKRKDLLGALKTISEEIESSLFIGTVKQHELLFAKGVVNISMYETINPLDDKFYWAAKEDFIHADNVYNSLNGRQSQMYKEAIIYADRTYSFLNTRAFSDSHQVPEPILHWFDEMIKSEMKTSH